MAPALKENPPPISIAIATRNKHKLQEIQTILGSGFFCQSLHAFPEAPSVEEDAPTFEGNATKKAVELANWLAKKSLPASLYVLADDSGLEVDALSGAPGVNSARFAAEPGKGNSPDSENNAKLLRLLAGVPAQQRKARFRCVLALTRLPGASPADSSPVCFADEAELATELFHGTCEGQVGFTPRGVNGFGYDPLFLPDGMEQSFAELSEEQKNRMSHRARALEKLASYFRRKAGLA